MKTIHWIIIAAVLVIGAIITIIVMRKKEEPIIDKNGESVNGEPDIIEPTVRCKSSINYFSPRIVGGELVTNQKTEMRFAKKIPVQAGEKVFVESEKYNGLFTVESVWLPTDRAGGAAIVNTPFVDIGTESTAGFPIDRTGGSISVCEEDLTRFLHE